ncbi:MAG: hypothetical protein M1840_003098 [Geoglossum simile]|nr:MAG: hypothetical protein M1840_003098 [Geoglossum simile]
MARDHDRQKHDGKRDFRQVRVQSIYQGQKDRKYFIVNDKTAHGSSPTDGISCGKAPNSPIERRGDCGYSSSPTHLAADGRRQTGLGKIYHALGTGLTNGTTSVSAIESSSRIASLSRRREIAQENCSHASSTDTPLNPEQATDKRRLPFNGMWDIESDVPMYQPSKENFSDFGNFMKIITGSDEFARIGVALSTSSTTDFASRAKVKISYYMQTSTVIEGTDNQVFEIHHQRSEGRSENDWKRKEKEAINRNGEKVDMQKMVDLLRGGGFQAPYMSNLEARPVLSRLCIPPIGLSQLPGNALNGASIPGMSSDYAYLGSPGSTAIIHLEDQQIPSSNYLGHGEPKEWLIISPKHKITFESVVKDLFPGKNSDCSQFVRHRNLFLDPEFLLRNGIGHCSILQEMGVMVVVHGEAYHQVLNTGSNIAIANNVAMPGKVYWHGYTQCSRETCGEHKPWFLTHGENGQILKIECE